MDHSIKYYMARCEHGLFVIAVKFINNLAVAKTEDFLLGHTTMKPSRQEIQKVINSIKENDIWINLYSGSMKENDMINSLAKNCLDTKISYINLSSINKHIN